VLRRPSAALVAATAVVLLSACTAQQPGPQSTDGTRPTDSATEATAAAPVVEVVDPDEVDAGDQKTPADDPSSEEGSEPGSGGGGAEASAPEQTEPGPSAPSGAAGTDAADIEFAPGDTFALAVTGGEFASVELLDADHSAVPADPGTVSEDGTGWQARAGLAGGASYEWRAVTTAADGSEHTTTGTFETSAPAGSTVRARSVIADDDTVGVGAPIIINFGGSVDEEFRDDVEQRLSVAVTDEDGEPREVDGGWAWLPNIDGHSRIHYRPAEFWPAHSQVAVDLPLEDVPFSESAHGGKDMTLDFEIGREQITVADAKTHRMTVTRDGEEVMDFPASLGAPRSPSYNGMHIVMSKAESYTMTSEQWGYSTPVTHAVRIHNNGEFIHAAPWSVGSQGSANVSHGCINLSTERASEYYDSAIYGDPVEITGSSVDLTVGSGEVADWVYSWEEWQELSALAD